MLCKEKFGADHCQGLKGKIKRFQFDIFFSFYFSPLTSFLTNRKTIKILFPKEAAERQYTQELSEDYKSLLSKFESLNIKHPRHSSSSEAQLVQHQHVGFGFSKIIFIVLSILGIAMVSVLAVTRVSVTFRELLLNPSKKGEHP